MSEFNLSLDFLTESILQRHSNLLPEVAPERIKNEIQKLVKGNWADSVIPQIDQIGLLSPWQDKSKVFIPEFHPSEHAKSFYLSEMALALPLYRLVYLLSDTGLNRLCFSKKDIQTCKILRKWQNNNKEIAFANITEYDRYKLHIELEKYLPALIIDLSKEDQIIWLKRWRDPDDPLFHPSSPLDGFELQEILGVNQGPLLGEILECLSIEKAFDRLHTREEAVQLAHYLWQQKQPFL